MRGERRSPLAVLGGGLLALNALVFAAYTLPRVLEKRGLDARAAALEREVQEERAAAEVARRQAEILRANAQDAARFSSEILGERRSSLLPTLEELESLARRAGLRPQTRTFVAEEMKGAPVAHFTITMPLSGSYAQILSFLEALEGSPRFVTVDQIQLRKASLGQELAVVLSAYFRSEKRGPS